MKNKLLETFVASYEDLSAYLSRRLGKEIDASDVLQDTFLRLQKIPVGTDIVNSRSYLFRVVDNLALDHLRSHQARTRRIAPDDFFDPADDRPSPEHVIDYRQRLSRLESAIAELPARQKQVFLMHKFDGLSHSQIGERLGITKSAVEKLIMKALAHCRDRLGDLLD